jgi:lysozyme
MDKIELIKKHEGLRLSPYKCTSGKLTIGYGRNIEDNGISKQEAEIMLFNDISSCEGELDLKIPIWRDLSEPRRAVLVNMVFNLGYPRFSKFKKMLKAIKEKDFNRAAAEMLDSRWARQVGNRAIELAEIMKMDKY